MVFAVGKENENEIYIQYVIVNPTVLLKSETPVLPVQFARISM